MVTLEGALNLVGLTTLGNPTDASNMRILVSDPLAGRVYALRIEEVAAITSTLASAGTSAITSALTSASATGVNAPRIDEAAEAPSPLPPLPPLPALDVAPLLQRLQDLESARHSAHQSTEDARHSAHQSTEDARHSARQSTEDAPPLASIVQASWRAPTSPPVEDDDEPID